MTAKDQELISEAYLNEVFGFGSKPQMIDLKTKLDPESYDLVTMVFRSNPAIRHFTHTCNSNSCLIDKNKIPKICSILKKQHETMDNDETSDNILDTHDILTQVYEPLSYKSDRPPEPWGYEPPQG
jgi:hypothetical protein